MYRCVPVINFSFNGRSGYRGPRKKCVSRYFFFSSVKEVLTRVSFIKTIIQVCLYGNKLPQLKEQLVRRPTRCINFEIIIKYTHLLGPQVPGNPQSNCISALPQISLYIKKRCFTRSDIELTPKFMISPLIYTRLK